MQVKRVLAYEKRRKEIESRHHEMEFLLAYLVAVSGHKLESTQTWVYIWFSTLIFPFYKMLFMNRLEFLVSQIILYGF